MIELPPTLLAEVDQLVQTGMFPSRDAAVAELLRLGLDVVKARAQRRPLPYPSRPPVPPGVNEPDDDRPISVDPRDPQFI